MDYVTISTTSNSSDFGDLTVAGYVITSNLASSTRGVFAVGGSRSNTMDYITIATTGNATDFGDTIRSSGGNAGCSGI